MKVGFDWFAAGKLRLELVEANSNDDRLRLIKGFLLEPNQVAARNGSPHETKFAEHASEFVSGYIQRWAESGAPLEGNEFMIDRLLKWARNDPISYAKAKPAIAAVVRSGNLPEQVKDFVADDYNGEVKPTSKTRRTAPKDHFRQLQAAVSVHVLKEAHVTERSAFKMVAEVMTEIGVSWPETYRHNSLSGQVTSDQIRAAYRKHKAVRWDC